MSRVFDDPKRDRPDQLDMQIAMEVATIRRLVNELRKRLGLEPRKYDE